MDKEEINKELESVGLEPLSDISVISVPKRSYLRAYLVAGCLTVSSIVGIPLYLDEGTKKVKVLAETNSSQKKSLEQMISKISVSGNSHQNQLEILYEGLVKIERNHPNLINGKRIFIFQNHDAYVDALIKDGDLPHIAKESDASTSPDYERIFLSPKAFANGKNQAIFVIAYQFGYVYSKTRKGKDSHKFAEELLGYKDLMNIK